MRIQGVIVDGTHRQRAVMVDLSGTGITTRFHLEDDDHPELELGTEVTVSLEPDDQFAKIVIGMSKEEFLKKFPATTDFNCNSLEDIACPKCGSRISFDIDTSAVFHVVDSGTMDHGDVEWDGNSLIHCGLCHHQGTVDEFTVEGLDAELRKINGCIEQQVVKLLGSNASYEFPGYVHIDREDGTYWAFGTINGVWDGHRCESDGNPCEPFIDLHIPGDSTDADAIARAIKKAIQ